MQYLETQTRLVNYEHSMILRGNTQWPVSTRLGSTQGEKEGYCFFFGHHADWQSNKSWMPSRAHRSNTSHNVNNANYEELLWEFAAFWEFVVRHIKYTLQLPVACLLNFYSQLLYVLPLLQ